MILEIVWTKRTSICSKYRAFLAAHDDLCVAFLLLIRLANDLSIVRQEGKKIDVYVVRCTYVGVSLFEVDTALH